MKKVFIYLVLSIFVIGCFITKLVGENKMMEVELGMSKQEVLDLMDLPKYRRVSHSVEEWEYHCGNTAEGENVLLIRFNAGKVGEIENFYRTDSVLEGSMNSIATDHRSN